MVAFTAGTTLTAAALMSGFNEYVINTQTGTTYQTVLTDRGNLVTLSNSSTVAVTIPAFATVAYATGTILTFLNLGVGFVTISPAATVTIDNGNITLAQYDSTRIVKTGTNTWAPLVPTGGGFNPFFLMGV